MNTFVLLLRRPSSCLCLSLYKRAWWKEDRPRKSLTGIVACSHQQVSGLQSASSQIGCEDISTILQYHKALRPRHRAKLYVDSEDDPHR